jgi:hypothetical protein
MSRIHNTALKGHWDLEIIPPKAVLWPCKKWKQNKDLIINYILYIANTNIFPMYIGTSYYRGCLHWLKRNKNVTVYILMMTVGNLSDLFSVIKGTVRLMLPGDQNKQLFNLLQEKPNFRGRGVWGWEQEGDILILHSEG